MPFDLAPLDRLRREQGYLTVGEVFGLIEAGNVILDPFSLLLGRHVRLGSQNMFYPTVSIWCDEASEITIADRNTFHTGTVLYAAPGRIVVGTGNELGERGFVAKANRPGAFIEIGDHGRYLGGATVYGISRLGSGSQILGAISVENCTLTEGASYTDPDPDRRGAVLKGTGVARGLILRRGEVIQGNGVFTHEAIKPQSFYHA
ncbi:MAG: AraC family transcriptional regulator [Xanthobacteraceae bacterium]